MSELHHNLGLDPAAAAVLVAQILGQKVGMLRVLPYVRQRIAFEFIPDDAVRELDAGAKLS